MKVERQKTLGFLQSVTIPLWKLKHIIIDFVFKLLHTPKKHNGMWMTVDCLTKSVHFFLVRETFSLPKLAKFFVSNIVSLY